LQKADFSTILQFLSSDRPIIRRYLIIQISDLMGPLHEWKRTQILVAVQIAIRTEIRHFPTGIPDFLMWCPTPEEAC